MSFIDKLMGIATGAGLGGRGRIDMSQTPLTEEASSSSTAGQHGIVEFFELTLKDREKKRARTIGGKKRPILQDVTFKLPTGAYALLGDPIDRMAFIDLIIGRRHAAAGKMNIYTRMSYPIGRIVHFSPPVIGGDYVRFLSQLYNFVENDALATMRDVLPWPNVLAHRLDDTRNHERLALSLGVATFIDVDTYIIDGNIIDPFFPVEFVRFVAERFAARTADRNILISTRQYQVACSVAVDSLIIENGQLMIEEGVDAGKVKATHLAVASAPAEERDDDDDGII